MANHNDNGNLLTINIESDLLQSSGDQQDYSLRAGTVEVVFRNLKERLIAEIEGSPPNGLILGAVAWLTEPDILDALATRPCAIVVQKEDFLRPDIGTRLNWKQRLHEQYGELDGGNWDRYALPGVVSNLNVASSPGLEGAGYFDQTHTVRCVGNHNSKHSPAFPRMHNKFLVFCERALVVGQVEARPVSVWTGSFNFTRNAVRSFENALHITDPAIAMQYALEWGQIYALSEPLDWSSEWVEPEFRIGT